MQNRPHFLQYLSVFLPKTPSPGNALPILGFLGRCFLPFREEKEVNILLRKSCPAQGLVKGNLTSGSQARGVGRKLYPGLLCLRKKAGFVGDGPRFAPSLVCPAWKKLSDAACNITPYCVVGKHALNCMNHCMLKMGLLTVVVRGPKWTCWRCCSRWFTQKIHNIIEHNIVQWKDKVPCRNTKSNPICLDLFWWLFWMWPLSVLFSVDAMPLIW